MTLIPNDMTDLLIANGRASREATEQQRRFDPLPLVKLFTPDANATWLLTEIDPDDPDCAFGLCDLGLGYPELGYVSLAEIRSVRGPLGLRVERDANFHASRPLSSYADEAYRQGIIRT
jgi:hypothetical protein